MGGRFGYNVTIMGQRTEWVAGAGLGLLVLATACATGGGISNENEQIEVTGVGGMGGMEVPTGGMGGMEVPMGGMGGMGGMSEGGTGGMPPACDFGHMHTCEMATDLGGVSGDDGGTVTHTGSGSEWVKIQIRETNGSIFEDDLSYRVTLTSPTGVDYDLAVHEGPKDGPVDCTADAKPGIATGLDKVVENGWDDAQGIGGKDDDVWLSIEVRHVSGTDCDAEWTLTIVGDP